MVLATSYMIVSDLACASDRCVAKLNDFGMVPFTYLMIMPIRTMISDATIICLQNKHASADVHHAFFMKIFRMGLIRALTSSNLK